MSRRMLDGSTADNLRLKKMAKRCDDENDVKNDATNWRFYFSPFCAVVMTTQVKKGVNVFSPNGITVFAHGDNVLILVFLSEKKNWKIVFFPKVSLEQYLMSSLLLIVFTFHFLLFFTKLRRWDFLLLLICSSDKDRKINETENDF